jgi:hypothetical protein
MASAAAAIFCSREEAAGVVDGFGAGFVCALAVIINANVRATARVLLSIVGFPLRDWQTMIVSAPSKTKWNKEAGKKLAKV